MMSCASSQKPLLGFLDLRLEGALGDTDPLNEVPFKKALSKVN